MPCFCTAFHTSAAALCFICSLPCRTHWGATQRRSSFANVNPAAACLRESQSTLAFAQRAKQVVNKAVVNEAAHGELAALTKENARLRRELRLVNDTCRALQQVRDWHTEHAPALACTC